MLLIRAAQPEDVGTILKLIRGLAEYERAPQAAQATEADLLRDGFGRTSQAPLPHRRLARRARWFRLYFLQLLHLEGASGNLPRRPLRLAANIEVKELAKPCCCTWQRIAVAENCGRYEWQVLDWNTPAIEFYEGLGAKRMTQWLPMRVEGEALLELAKKS